MRRARSKEGEEQGGRGARRARSKEGEEQGGEAGEEDAASGGSGYDGIAFYEIAGGMISYNNITGSQGIGIHLSDYTSDYGYDDDAPTTAPDVDASTTINVWTKNVFGTTDPVGLSK